MTKPKGPIESLIDDPKALAEAEARVNNPSETFVPILYFTSLQGYDELRMNDLVLFLGSHDVAAEFSKTTAPAEHMPFHTFVLKVDSTQVELAEDLLREKFEQEKE